ncbi:dihydroorotase family protein [Lentzea sp. NPDC059081]|uniref:dihydroorotase n=1 Tax=Lentzea sp. NPDC059081 TaxID=3346719 RepID=UPI00368C944F
MTAYDLVLHNIDLVLPGADEPVRTAIAVRDGKVAAIGPELATADAAEVVDGGGKLAFPGVVDAHQHWGIYHELGVDSESESRACAQGGVTTALNYMRTGQYYLNRGGSYGKFFPEVLETVSGRAWVDYGFHLAPMMSEHIDEIPSLISDYGVPSFKVFMFYGSHGLHGKSSDQSDFLMIPEGERYDYAHFEFVMRGIQAAREKFPELAEEISLSLHCETAEIMTAYTERVEKEGKLTGLEAYSASRPPHSEGLAITIASYLAHETGLANINLLHLTSRKALDAAMRMAEAFPHIDFRREVTIGHLLADYTTASGLGGKVNPPLRSREDVDALWESVADGTVDWVVSDHACCKDERKFGEGDQRDDVFAAKSGFGGTEYLLAGLVSEGRRRGVPLGRLADLVTAAPARRYGLRNKGNLEVGFDADIALVDPDHTWVVRAEDSESSQEYTPFEGQELTVKVTDTFLRGTRVLQDGKIVGEPSGRYQSRPVGVTG